MAKATKKATKYELSRSDISDKLRELIGKLEDSPVYETTPGDLENVLNDILGELEGLSDDVFTKAY